MATNKTSDRQAQWARADAVMEAAWKESGDLKFIALTVGFCRAHNMPPPAWAHEALLEVADADGPAPEIRRNAICQVRYVAVREARDHHGLSWDDAKVWAAERLRGTPAEAEPETMWKDYKHVRKNLRESGAVRDDDDPGYHWVDDKSLG